MSEKLKMKSNKLRVPKLRFKEFSGEWEEKKVGDIGKVSMCKRIMKDQTTIDEKIPFYKIGTFGKEADAFISEELYGSYKSKYSFPKKGDILISASGTIGRTVVYNGEDAYFQDSNIVWIDNKEEMTKNSFLIFCYENIEWNTENTTIARLYNDNLRNIQLNIPIIQEQEKIASFLSSIDKKIEQLSKKDELLESYKKGVMQKIFSQVIRFKADNGSDYSDWEEKKLEDITLKISDGIHSTPKYDEKGLFYFINGNNLVNGKIKIDNNTKRISEKEFLKYKRDLNSTTILLSINGTIGNLALYNDEKVLLGKSACYINIDEKQIIKYFIYNILKTKNIENFFYSEVTGSTIKNLSLNTIKNTKIKLPQLEEQTKIANFLSSIDTKISQNRKALEETKKFKKALLQQMFV